MFNELKRRNSSNPLAKIFYWQGRGEVDFIIKNNLKISDLVQVCWNIDNKETKEREVSALLEAMKKFNLNNGTIITEDAEGHEKIGGLKIEYIPLWKWLLG